MKKLIELTIPVLVALTWGVLAVTTLQHVGDLAAAVAGPSPDRYGPPVRITPASGKPTSRGAALHVAPDRVRG